MIVSSVMPSPLPSESVPIVLGRGATGSLGPAVVFALRNAGYRIRILARDISKVTTLPDDVQLRIGDITDPLACDAAVEGAYGIIHAAAFLHVMNPPPSLQ